MVRKEWTPEEIAESDRKYEESRRRPNNVVGVRVVGTDLEFPSITACAKYFRVKDNTIARLMRSKEQLGDLKFEEID